MEIEERVELNVGPPNFVLIKLVAAFNAFSLSLAGTTAGSAAAISCCALGFGFLKASLRIPFKDATAWFFRGAADHT